MTFARACAHFDNDTAAHESRTHHEGAARYAFPDRHIEIDNRLSWLLGRLDRHWGDQAAYVHLTRDPEEVAESFRKRAGQGIIKAYKDVIIARSTGRAKRVPVLEFCRDYVDTVTENIATFLADKSHVMHIRLETAQTDFPRFCEWIGATGDMKAALGEFSVRHNATPNEKDS